ncbi:LCP family protein [Streptomyces sp. VRA16 Mangrove soil]|uniref:LCP family protein n=1 Tax=Streptomyces sp. VRA16 Mangrove soil TaxID=2817434 RepID=UPI001A9CECC2|nr:LCP family protein [Streptomyces sp. VRA16 Mangrove soil]MBO1336650.1 LCP family protein [Streptomyces sp. VRA16 Mangrove soil]
MDAQGRGRADNNVDPADQWVLNPQTGDYELRLNPSGGQSTVPGPRRSASGRRQQQDVPSPRRRREPPAQAAGPGRRRSKPKKKKSKVKKVLLWTTGGMSFVVLVTAVGGYLYYQHLNGNITVTKTDEAKDYFSKDEAFNILVIGTDKRTGKGNEGYGDKGSVGHADTNILLHVSKDRSNATALSIPRDLIVDVPDCTVTDADGKSKVIPGSTGVRFNTSLGQDGRDPGCTMKTVKAVTGITPDHFMMADFNAVKTLTSAVGGVEVCVAKDVDDPDSHLKLSKGKHTLAGEQALAFLRTRHSFGNQGDLDRIKVQQQFLGSLARKMSSGDTITNPVKLTRLAEAATKALTVDQGIGSLGKLKDVALEINKVPTKNISFVTTPVVDNPTEKVHATVVVNDAQAPAVFNAIKNDVSLTETKKKAKAAQAAKLKGPKSAASEVRVDLYNGSEKTGAAQETLTWLQNSEGVLKSSQLGNKPTQKKTTLEYSPDQADQARRLADIMGLPASALKEGKSEKNDQGLPAMILILGQDFQGAGTPIDGASAKAPKVDKQTADKTVCAQ